MEKDQLLILCDHNRKDFLLSYRSVKDQAELIFLEFASKRSIYNYDYKNYGKVIFWSEFRDAFDLLEKIGPKKVIFLWVDTYQQVALNLACKIKGIKTYVIDHGVYDWHANIELENYFFNAIKGRHLSHLKKIFQEFTPRFKTRLFLSNTINKLPEPEKSFLRNYVGIRKNSTHHIIRQKLQSELKMPDAYISYSPKNFSVSQHFEKITVTSPVHFIGVPIYDDLINITPLSVKSSFRRRNILLIDQGLANRNLLGWTKASYANFLKELSAYCQLRNYTLNIKFHPTDINAVKDYNLSNLPISVIRDDQINSIIATTQVIIGFFSTLLLPLAAMPHTTLITLENHPAGRLDVSKSFVDAGVAYPIYSLDELPAALDNIEELHKKQLPNKKHFERDWLYKFDGKSGERLRDILLSDEL